eukprot:285926-Chlamydomonas_euryale.AAC.4
MTPPPPTPSLPIPTHPPQMTPPPSPRHTCALEHRGHLNELAAIDARAAWVLVRVVLRVDAQPVEHVGVCAVVLKHSELREFGAHAVGLRRPLGVVQHPEPEAVASGRAARHVVGVCVVGVGDPERRGRRVGVEHRVRLACEEAQVVVKHVARLDAVLQEERMTHHVVRDRVLDQRAVGAVDHNGAVVCVVDGAAFDVLPAHVAVHVPVDRVLAEQERLPHLRELDLLEAPPRRRVMVRRRERARVAAGMAAMLVRRRGHHAGAKLVLLARRVALQHDRAREHRDLGTHVERVTAVITGEAVEKHTEVRVGQRPVQRQRRDAACRR